MTCIEALLMIYTTKPFRLAASAFYRLAYKLHHKLFLRPQPPIQTPVIIVGSYLAGGAGKTPFTIWLVRHFYKQGKHIAILCHSAAWDEFIMLQRALESIQSPPAASPQIKVFATRNRYSTAKEIQDKFDIILCDDGFEDTRFTGVRHICLDWQEPPTSWTCLMPAGPFRSLRQDHDERDIIHLACYGNTPDIRFSIKFLTNSTTYKQFTAKIICGLGSPNRFIEDVRTFASTAGIQIAGSIIRPDHDRRFPQIVQTELSQGNDIIISQKDASRLPQALLSHPKLHVAIQKTEVSDKILQKLSL